MLSCRTREVKLLCLKNRGSTSRASVAASCTRNVFPPYRVERGKGGLSEERREKRDCSRQTYSEIRRHALERDEGMERKGFPDEERGNGRRRRRGRSL
jgi:hypothetical protein